MKGKSCYKNHVEINKELIHWFSGTTSSSNSSLGLFYSIYLGPEIKKKKHPIMAEELLLFFLGGGGGGGGRSEASQFVLHVERRCQDPEVKRPFDLYWWVELLMLDKNLYF